MKTIFLTFSALSLALAQQDGPTVVPSVGPGPVCWTSINYYDGSNRIIYECKARCGQSQSAPDQQLTISAATNANPVSLTITAHGLGDFATHGATFTPVIAISGLAGNWAGLNGVWVATVTSANAVTVPFNSAAAGSFSGQSPVAFTTAPRWNKPVWSISKFFYDASSNLIGLSGVANPGGAGATDMKIGTLAAAFSCSGRASFASQ